MEELKLNYDNDAFVSLELCSGNYIAGPIGEIFRASLKMFVFAQRHRNCLLCRVYFAFHYCPLVQPVQHKCSSRMYLPGIGRIKISIGRYCLNSYLYYLSVTMWWWLPLSYWQILNSSLLTMWELRGSVNYSTFPVRNSLLYSMKVNLGHSVQFRLRLLEGTVQCSYISLSFPTSFPLL